jgi:branched-chain amino acid transport system ATP-binding protein
VTSAPALSAEIQSAGYGGPDVLSNVSITVDAGEIVAVLGANGAGKTTLLRTLSGVVVRSSAQVVLDGTDVSRLPPHRRVKAGLAHVPEARRILVDLSVRENLRVPAVALRLSESEFNRRASGVFDLFPILLERTHQRAGSLSGGEQQMLAIGRALILDPRVLMIDEASLGLAPIVVQRLFQSLTELKGQRLGILLVEQNAIASLAISDRAYVLEHGHVVVSGPSREIRSDDRMVSAYLGARGVVPGAEVGDRDGTVGPPRGISP